MIILKSGIGNFVYSNSKKYSYFGGNNYLGLANHPDIKKASIQAIEDYGINFSASRCTTGTADIHLKLEKELSHFKDKQDTIIFASGYQGNSILLEILKNRYSIVLMDEFAHPSIKAGIPCDIKNVLQYKHCDTNHLEELLNHYKSHTPLIITDGIFPLTGEIAPLDRIYPIAKKYGAILIVDDAHSTGILGPNGRGTPEHFNLPEDENIFQTETMSKALGSYGGFISSNREMINRIRDNSTTYQASTALPPSIIAAGSASLKLIQEKPEMRTQLLEKAFKLRNSINELGFQTTSENTPIIPIMFSTLNKAIDLSRYLENEGIIAPFVNYPVKLNKFIVRFTVSANHQADQIEELTDMLVIWKNKNGTDE